MTIQNKKKSQYRSTEVKARNFLSNADYRRFKKEGNFKKPNFVTDVATFLIQNLNPIALDRKLKTDTERNHVKMTWVNVYRKNSLYSFLCNKNYFMLSETQVTYQKGSDILNEFFEKN